MIVATQTGAVAMTNAIMTPETCRGRDELYEDLFVSPCCGHAAVRRSDNFCANCGVKLDWSAVPVDFDSYTYQYNLWEKSQHAK